MVMMSQPLADALAAVKTDGGGAKVLALAPNGERLTDARARQYARAVLGEMQLTGRSSFAPGAAVHVQAGSFADISIGGSWSSEPASSRKRATVTSVRSM